MKKLLALIFALGLCLPMSVMATNYNYSDNFITIDFTDKIYSSTKLADYSTHYACRSMQCYARTTASGKTKTAHGYQTCHSQLLGVKIDNNHKHEYWHDN